MSKVVVITVHYKGADSTAAFLESAAKLECFDTAHLLVVENGSGDGSAEMLRPLVARFRNVELLESPLNRGYFGGAKWGLQQYLARGYRPDWVIICNNDILFDDRQLLSKLFQRDPENAQVIAPAIIERLTNLDCNPFLRKRPSQFRLWRYRFWLSNYYLSWFLQLLSPYMRVLRYHTHFGGRRLHPNGCAPIYAAHGSFLIFSRSYFDAGGYIDDGFFLYAEELSVAEICQRLNLRVIHDPTLRVWHDAHQVTGRMCNRNTFHYSRQGLEYALRTYFTGPSRAESRESDRGLLHQTTGTQQERPR
jgi:GT2 family glycosyltransferase